ncbi:hypothetical protein HPB50_015258 [Hyalomma asiaticum]|uniref:Uncharacterized protein n=1 Tax=Hyalomma asiaticum TaxID=266040 RepID=A0ACB7RMD5_HYAAI|nr:hypothetical protein HPB50_015258 [Hyalomma asiaticum]
MNSRTGFGFNPNIFSALAEETKHMDRFSYLGGIVLDEIKLSEHLDVKSNGLMLTQDLGGDEYSADSLLPYADNCSLPEENAFCSRSGSVALLLSSAAVFHYSEIQYSRSMFNMPMYAGCTFTLPY